MVVLSTIPISADLIKYYCPSGYTLSGTTCNLTDPRSGIADNKVDYSRSGAVYSAPSSSDADHAQTLQGTITGSGAGVQIAGTNASGMPVAYNVTAREDGGSVVQQQTAVATAAGDTGTKTETFQISPTGVIETATQTTTADQLAVDPAASPSSATISVVAADPNASSSTLYQGFQFPNDYARVGEAAAAANILAPKLDNIKDALTTTATVDDPTLPAVEDMPGFGDTFTDLLAWRLPPHSSACPQPTVDLSSIFGAGHVYTLSSHCTLLQDNSSIIHASMVLMFTIMALFIVLRA